MGRSPARRVTPSLQTPLLICFLAPVSGCRAKEGLVHGTATAPSAPHREWLEREDGCPRPTPDRSHHVGAPLYHVEAALGWAVLGWAGPGRRTVQ